MDKLRSLDIKYLKGIGPSRAELLSKQLGIKTYYDLLYHFPTHYVDRSQIYKIKDLHGFSGDVPSIQLRGRFVSFNIQGEGAKKRLIGAFSDGSGLIEAVWFNSIKHIQSAINPGAEYIIFGKPTLFQNRWSIVHPEVDTTGSTGALQGLRGVYPLTEQLRNRNITSRTIFGWEQTLLANLTTLQDTLPQHIIDHYHLPALRDALMSIHNPRNLQELQKAQLRLKFEELFFLQLNILRYSRKRTAAIAGFRFTRIGEYFNSFYKSCLPFELTNAQKRVIKEIRADVGSGRQMNRLLQGDVGSGKTLVALMCMLIALDNGTQACLMAPTEILATQHYETIGRLVAPIGINVKLLTGSTRKKERESIHSQLQDGTLHILIGTHAVIEDNVQFKNLGLTVIDEQHRFGVAQRARLWRKNAIPPHVLVMTATPIPRTLAMTVY
ncbi:MAG: DEAD/DEAH box helicase, partial [Muribaculaceae bacterium]|nr:DEAD/DEAH box helicase [Muribaculaceae bacterium]